MMKKISLPYVLAGLVIIILVFFSFTFFTVPEGQKAISSHDETVILNPGLHFKLPGETVSFITVNNQISTLVIPLSGDAQNLQVAVGWNVQDALLLQKAGQNTESVVKALQTEIAPTLTPSVLAANSSPQALSTLILQNLQANTTLTQDGISVTQVWITGIIPTTESQTAIYTGMKGLGSSIGEGIIQNAEQQAQTIRNQAEQQFLQVQSAALQQAAVILGQGNMAAVKVMAPLYHQNPALFKAYVAAKTNLLAKANS